MGKMLRVVKENELAVLVVPPSVAPFLPCPFVGERERHNDVFRGSSRK